jgi:integrase
MLAYRKPRIPSYRFHRASKQAVVTIGGKDHYLGRYDSHESRVEYDRLIAEWLAAGRRVSAPQGAPASDLTINELVLRYVEYCDGYYRKNGQTTSEAQQIRLSMRPVRQLYGDTLAAAFGPLALKAVRQRLIDGKLARTEINKRIRRIVRAFNWATSEQILPESVYNTLKTVEGLKRGRSEARESQRVRTVPDEHVNAIRPHVSRQVWAMIELQRLTGMRAGEVTIMRTINLDMSGPVWRYVPSSHKTEHHDRERVIFLGPRAQDVLRPWLKTDLTAYLFSPREATEERRAKMRAARKTRVQPLQVNRKKARARRVPGERYDVPAYNRAIDYGCRKADVPKFGTHQLRHNAATLLRQQFGLDVAKAVLGHSTLTTTQVYAEIDIENTMSAMRDVI